MKIAFVCSRGIPARYGGFETFAQELAIRLVKRGHEVEVYCDKDSYPKDSFEGVKLRFASCTKTGNANKYCFESVAGAIKDKCDIVLCCGQGGAIALLCKRLGGSHSILITNMDGIEHRRTKWNRLIRLYVLICCEFFSVLASHYLVADSKGIKDYLLGKYKWIRNRVFTIEYGAYLSSHADLSLLRKWNLQPGEYYLVVSRLEPENNVDTIIKGYKLSHTGKKLVVVGNLNQTPFVQSLLEEKNDQILFTNGIYNSAELSAMREGCAAYLHGHSVGGTNPSLLEALGAGNIVIAHDNVFNREVTDNQMWYFDTPEKCAQAIDAVDVLEEEERLQKQRFARERIQGYYNWDRIANDYEAMFKEVLKRSHKN